jgi:hypothetical protein
MNFQDLINQLSRTYFTTIFSFSSAILGFVLIKKKHPQSFIFLSYLAAYIALEIVFISCALFRGKIQSALIHHIELYADYVFTLFEFCVFIFFFKQTLSYKSHRRMVNLISVVYLCGSFLLLIKDFLKRDNLETDTEVILWELQAICLLIPCVFYFIQIFRSAKNYLSRERSFWIVSGLSLFMASSLPFSIFSNYILAQSTNLAANFTAIFNIFYCVLFLMITKGHLCKVENSKKRVSATIENMRA